MKALVLFFILWTNISVEAYPGATKIVSVILHSACGGLFGTIAGHLMDRLESNSIEYVSDINALPPYFPTFTYTLSMIGVLAGFTGGAMINFLDTSEIHRQPAINSTDDEYPDSWDDPEHLSNYELHADVFFYDGFSDDD